MIKFNPCIFLASVAVTMSFWGSSCQQADVFDEAAYNDSLAAKFPVSNIDPNQTWQTVGSATVNVTVNEDYGKTYQIKIYKENPLLHTTVTLLAEGSVVSGNTFTTTMDYPLVDSIVYVTRLDPEGRRVVIPTSIVNGTVTASFGIFSTATKTTRAYTRATDEYTISAQSAPYTQTDVANLLNGASDATAVTNLPQGGNTKYYIAKDYAGSISYWDVSTPYKLIVTGKWTLSTNQSIDSNLEIIVASGGELVIPSGISLTSNSNKGNLTVLNGGKVTGNGTINFNSGGSNYNGGSITANTLNNNGGTFYNADGSYLNVANLIQTSSSSTLVNYSSDCTIGTCGSSDGSASNATIQNACKMTVTKTLAANSIILGNGASITCADLNAGGGSNGAIHLNQNSILWVSNTVYLNSLKIYGPTTGSAICKFTNLIYENATYAYNNVYIDNTTLSPNGDGREIQGDPKYVASGEAPLTIDASSCSIGYTQKGTDNTNTATDFSSIYAFEDNYPDAGDYDFNDVVMTIIRKKVNDKQLTLTVVLNAVGAAKQSGAGLRLSGLTSSDITSITSDNGFGATWGNLFATANSNGYEDNENSEIVIPLFDDAHQVLMGTTPTSRPLINTVTKNYDTKTLVLTINTTSSTVTDKIISSTIDPFITYLSGSTKYEVHTYPWKNNPTNRGAVFNPSSAVSGSKYIWAVCVPGTFIYPKEYVSIETAYLTFANWASDMTTDKDWYESPVSGKVFK